MATAGTPRRKYPFHVPKKEKAKGYEIRLAAQFGDAKAKSKLQAYNRRIKERRMEANKSEWVVEGRNFNRYKMMDFIVSRVANGESLPKVCESEAMPSMLEVYSWFESHPDFEKAYRRAEEVRGHLLGEESLTIARETDRENVAADKLKVETLAKAAARANARFQDKQVVKTEDEFANMSAEQIKSRIDRILSQNPELTAHLPASLASSLPSQEIVELEPEHSLPTLDLAQTDTPERDGD